MDIKSEFDKYFKRLLEFLKLYDFKLIKGKKIALKNTSNGFNKIFFDINKSIDFKYSTTLSLKIRSDKIQEIKYHIDCFHDKDTSTILTHLYSYLDKINKKELDFESGMGHIINFEEQTSIDKWFRGFEKFMNEAGFSFFESFKSDEDFDKWFNQPLINGTYDFSKGMRWNDSVSGLVAAKLVNNPAYEEIYKIWCEQLPKYNEMKTLDELKKMKEYLDNNKIV